MIDLFNGASRRSCWLHFLFELVIAHARGEVGPLSMLLFKISREGCFNQMLECAVGIFKAVKSHTVVRGYVLGDALQVKVHLLRINQDVEDLLELRELLGVRAPAPDLIRDAFMETETFKPCNSHLGLCLTCTRKLSLFCRC